MHTRSGSRVSGLSIAMGTVAGALLLPVFVIVCTLARFKRKPVDVGIGPDPIINNVYHKRALQRYGYSAETFVHDTLYITDGFDFVFRRRWPALWLPGRVASFASSVVSFVVAVWRYKILYISFNGGPLAVFPGFLARLEPALLGLAGVKTLVLPYGSDVQDMTRSQNLYFKHAMSLDYPAQAARRVRVAENIDRWTSQASHLIAGVEWVDYMSGWDTLVLAHFSIDTEALKPSSETVEPYVPGARPLRVLHAPNHRNIKGSQAVVRAVEELRANGHGIELEIIEKRPNREVLEAIERADLVIDQLVVGWYAMFAIEAMAMAKPTICYLRDDLLDLYLKAGLLQRGECPLLCADVLTIKPLLSRILAGETDLQDVGLRGRQYVVKHHSLDAIGTLFDRINRSLDILPADPGLNKTT